MHEISLCEDMRTLLEEQAAEQRFGRVTRIWLDVGAFSCVEPEALRFSFDAVMRGSVAEGASLEIVPSSGQAMCLSCGADFAATRRFEPCPACGSDIVQVTGGDALRINKLEVV